MAIEAHLYPYFAPSQIHNEKQVLNLNPNVLLSDSHNAFTYNTAAANKYNNQQPISQSLAVQFDEQSDAVDQIIRSQNEKLRIMIQEHRRQQVETLLKKVETNVLHVLIQKDEQIAQAARKKVELEEFLTRLEIENQTWRRAAQESEAMVLSLHNTLEQIQQRAYYCFNNGIAAEDIESCCDQNMTREEERGIEENRVYFDGVGEGEKITKQTLVCKCCHSNDSSFMLLPCRHLCACRDCEPFLQACPVCRMPKKSNIEILIF